MVFVALQEGYFHIIVRDMLGIMTLLRQCILLTGRITRGSMPQIAVKIQRHLCMIMEIVADMVIPIFPGLCAYLFHVHNYVYFWPPLCLEKIKGHLSTGIYTFSSLFEFEMFCLECKI